MGMESQNFKIPTDLFYGYRGRLVAHNMKFDYQVLRQAGIHIPVDNLWCTLMLSVYIDESKFTKHDLDSVLSQYLGEHKKVIEKKALEKFGWTSAPTEYMALYAEQDSQYLPDLLKALLLRSEEKHIKMWIDVDRQFMLLLADIEKQGIPIDRELCMGLDDLCNLRLAEIQEALGFDPAKPSQLHPKLFSDPPYGLGLKVPSRTPTGKPQVSLDWLASVGHPTTALLYEYRKTAKQKSSYFSAYLRLSTRDYPRLHPTFNQGKTEDGGGTDTGRLSCKDPNLQQIPREEYKDAEVKRLFLPEQGKQLWEVDYRTIEYRLSAVYSQSITLTTLFENEGDFHQLVADDVSAKSGVQVTRQKAKTINYLMSFGGGINVLKNQLGVELHVAAKIHKAYKETYWEIFEKASEAQQVAESEMQIDTWMGRTRHFKFPSECHKAFNAVIQGGAFEIMKKSMLNLKDSGFNVSNCVHDSVWLNVDSEAQVIEAQHYMEDWTKDYFGLTFRTDRKRLN